MNSFKTIIILSISLVACSCSQTREQASGQDPIIFMTADYDFEYLPPYYDYQYFNHNGELLIDQKFDEGGYFSEGIARVMLNGKYGYLNKDGVLIVPCKYDDASEYFSNGYVRVKKMEKRPYPCKK